jgi:hypothetical protein
LTLTRAEARDYIFADLDPLDLSIRMIINPPMMLRSATVLVFICCAAFTSSSAQKAPSGQSEASEFQNMDPVLKFLRTRNARDYAVTTPNGIDEANYVKIGGLEQWITILGEDRLRCIQFIYNHIR